MALNREHKQRIIDAWLDSCNAILYKQENGDAYIVSPLGDEDIRLGSWDELFKTAWYNNNEAVDSLRRQGEDDEDIKGYGLILPEQIAMWTQEEQAMKVERCYTGGGIYIYRGTLTDGRFFVASDDWGWEESVGEIVSYDPFAKEWDELFDGTKEFEDGFTGKQTRANIKDLWEFANEQVE